jgi:hypothetical protein
MSKQLSISESADKIFFARSITEHSISYKIESSNYCNAIAYSVTDVPNTPIYGASPLCSLAYQITFNKIQNQFNVIGLATMMFKGSKPMRGRELEILNKTYKRLLSPTPTTFIKK